MPEYTIEYNAIVRRRGVVVSEYNFHRSRVQIVSYWPNGQIESHGNYDIDEFIKIARQIQDKEESPYKEIE